MLGKQWCIVCFTCIGNGEFASLVSSLIVWKRIKKEPKTAANPYRIKKPTGRESRPDHELRNYLYTSLAPTLDHVFTASALIIMTIAIK